MKKTCCFLYIMLHIIPAFAQTSLKLKVADAATKNAIPTAKIKINELPQQAVDAAGAIIIALPAGKNVIEISAFNYEVQTQSMETADTAWHTVYLEAKASELEEVTFISSTRSSQSMENSPMKVEVLGKEEVSEEVGIKPGNIASILGDVSGVQIQQSSAVSGNSNVRIQGLSGRYTQILRDGMPLYDGFSGGFGILTIPPLDLRQIELIKGSASTLYGGGAIAGLVNLISKRPTVTQEADFVANITTLGEADLNGYIARRKGKIGYTLFAGYVRQKAKDVNDDGFSDVPNAKSTLVHPKLFFYPTDKTIISLGYSGTFDNRKGGDMYVLANGQMGWQGIHNFYEENTTQRHTGEYAVEHFYSSGSKLVAKGLVSRFYKNAYSSYGPYEAAQVSHYNEVSFNKMMGKAELVAGINVSGDDYNTLYPTPQLGFVNAFSNLTYGAFSQLSYRFKENTILEGGLRVDKHNQYGLFVLPRLALFHRINEQFATRFGFGMGYKTPNPFSPQDVENGIVPINTLDPSLNAEKSYGYNAEANYKKSWGKNKTIFINHAFFLTQVDKPILFTTNPVNHVNLSNAAQPLLTMGFDTYVKLTLNKWELYGGYTYTDARREYLSANKTVPLTPRNRMAFVLVREIEEKWRFGMEGSYFGSQYRYDGTCTPPYFFMALMTLYNINKHLAVVANCENVLNYKMSNEESLYTGTISTPQFKPLWAPIDGRVINVSVRLKM